MATHPVHTLAAAAAHTGAKYFPRTEPVRTATIFVTPMRSSVPSAPRRLPPCRLPPQQHMHQQHPHAYAGAPGMMTSTRALAPEQQQVRRWQANVPPPPIQQGITLALMQRSSRAPCHYCPHSSSVLYTYKTIGSYQLHCPGCISCFQQLHSNPSYPYWPHNKAYMAAAKSWPVSVHGQKQCGPNLATRLHQPTSRAAHVAGRSRLACLR